MAASLSLDRYMRTIRSAGASLASACESAGLDAEVPTCPGWTAVELVAHQGMVHRWAAANLLGEQAPFNEESAVISAVGRSAILDWFREGVEHLLDTLAAVREDVDAFVFLADAARPREFWARRQAHETTMHAVDAVAARLGRTPSADELQIDTDFAVDGIDELVLGFMPRGRRTVRFADPVRLSVEPVDSDRRGRSRWVRKAFRRRRLVRPTAMRCSPGRRWSCTSECGTAATS